MTNRFKYILKKIDENEVEITNKKFYSEMVFNKLKSVLIHL